MTETHEIVSSGTLHVIEKDGTLSYRLSDGDSSMILMTKPPKGSVLDSGVSRYRNAKVIITIEIDDNQSDYTGVQL